MKRPLLLIVFGSILGVLSLFLYIHGTQPVNAQDGSVGLSISPVTFELSAEAGDRLIEQVKVFNPTQSPMTVRMKVEDFTAVGDEGQVALMEPDENYTYSLARWVTVAPSEFILEAGKQQYVTVEISIPSSAEPGGHYGSIVASLSGAVQDVTGSAVGNERGSLILLRVAGNVEEALLIDTFSAPSFSEYGPIPFEIKFENIGNVHVKPKGFVTITNMSGKEIAQLEIPERNVLPGAKRQADLEWSETNMIGRFTATMVANYGQGQVITDTVTFTVFPWKIALAILAVVVILVVLIAKMRTRFGKAMKVLTEKE